MRSETECSKQIIKFYMVQYQKNLLKITKLQRHSVFGPKVHGLKKELLKFLIFFVPASGLLSLTASFAANHKTSCSLLSGK